MLPTPRPTVPFANQGITGALLWRDITRDTMGQHINILTYNARPKAISCAPQRGVP